MSSPNIRAALPEEAGVLSELAMRSKAHWGYSAEFMEACREELTVNEADIGNDDYPCNVAEQGGAILGYYSLQEQADGVYELDALFVDPPYIGSGVGRSLIKHAIQVLAERGAARLIIQGDPNAAEFYETAGAVQVGSRESGSIPGRQLPLYELVIA